MSEYWKSNPKKWCEICKIWIADNKIQVENHERGLKHKGMLQQKLRDMGKAAKERETQAAKLNATLVAMEQAAHAAMKRDIDDPTGASSSALPQVLAYGAPTIGYVPTNWKAPPPDARDLRQAINVPEQPKNRKEKRMAKDWEPMMRSDEIKPHQHAQLWPKDWREAARKRRRNEDDEARESAAGGEMAAPLVETSAQPRPELTYVADLKAQNDDSLNSHNDQQLEQLHASSADQTNATEERAAIGAAASGGGGGRRSLLGPWMPVERPKTPVEEAPSEPVELLTDLPAQEASKKKPLFDEDAHGAETNFAEKTLPTLGAKKAAKPIAFRKPKSKTTAKTED